MNNEKLFFQVITPRIVYLGAKYSPIISNILFEMVYVLAPSPSSGLLETPHSKKTL